MDAIVNNHCKTCNVFTVVGLGQTTVPKTVTITSFEDNISNEISDNRTDFEKYVNDEMKNDLLTVSQWINNNDVLESAFNFDQAGFNVDSRVGYDNENKIIYAGLYAFLYSMDKSINKWDT